MLADNFSDIFQRGLEYAWDCEHRLLKELPRIADAVSSDELRSTFLQHLEEAGTRVQRLEGVFARLDRSPYGEGNEPFKVIASEGEKLIHHIARSPLLDAALIFYANQTAHYQIALYGTLRSFANTLGQPDLADLMEISRVEARAADRVLTELAEDSINAQAAKFHNKLPFAII
jgi:ferritin-like metal-binding protein YciE